MTIYSSSRRGARRASPPAKQAGGTRRDPRSIPARRDSGQTSAPPMTDALPPQRLITGQRAALR